MRILGIDPALSVTGYGIIEENHGSHSLVAAGTIETRTKDTMPARLSQIYSAIMNVIAANRPDVMAVEKVFVHGQHPLTAFLLGEARGMICLAAATSGIPMEEYAATQIKKAVTGRGQASKEQIQRMILNLLRLEGPAARLDVTDALAAAVTHSHCTRGAAAMFSKTL